MTSPSTDKSKGDGPERNRRYEAKRKAEGYRRRWLWLAPGADWDKIRAYVERENRRAVS